MEPKKVIDIINDFHAHCSTCERHIYCRSDESDPNSYFVSHLNQPGHRVNVAASKANMPVMIKKADNPEVWVCQPCNIDLIPQIQNKKNDIAALVEIHEKSFEHKYRAFCLGNKRMSFLMTISLNKKMETAVCAKTKSKSFCSLCDKEIWEIVSIHLRTQTHLQQVRKFLEDSLQFNMDDIDNAEKVSIVLAKLLDDNLKLINAKTVSTNEVSQDEVSSLEEHLDGLVLHENGEKDGAITEVKLTIKPKKEDVSKSSDICLVEDKEKTEFSKCVKEGSVSSEDENMRALERAFSVPSTSQSLFRSSPFQDQPEMSSAIAEKAEANTLSGFIGDNNPPIYSDKDEMIMEQLENSKACCMLCKESLDVDGPQSDLIAKISFHAEPPQFLLTKWETFDPKLQILAKLALHSCFQALYNSTNSERGTCAICKLKGLSRKKFKHNRTTKHLLNLLHFLSTKVELNESAMVMDSGGTVAQVNNHFCNVEECSKDQFTNESKKAGDLLLFGTNKWESLNFTDNGENAKTAMTDGRLTNIEDTKKPTNGYDYAAGRMSSGPTVKEFLCDSCGSTGILGNLMDHIHKCLAPGIRCRDCLVCRKCIISKGPSNHLQSVRHLQGLEEAKIRLENRSILKKQTQKLGKIQSGVKEQTQVDKGNKIIEEENVSALCVLCNTQYNVGTNEPLTTQIKRHMESRAHLLKVWEKTDKDLKILSHLSCQPEVQFFSYLNSKTELCSLCNKHVMRQNKTRHNIELRHFKNLLHYLATVVGINFAESSFVANSDKVVETVREFLSDVKRPPEGAPYLARLPKKSNNMTKGFSQCGESQYQVNNTAGEAQAMPDERLQNLEKRGISEESKQSNEDCASRKPLIDVQKKPNQKSKTSQSGGSKNEIQSTADNREARAMPNERPQNIEIRGISGISEQSNEGCASRKPLIDVQKKPNQKSKTSQSGGSKIKIQSTADNREARAMPNERPQNIEIRGISGISEQSNEGCASRKPLIDVQKKPNQKSKTSQSGGSKIKIQSTADNSEAQAMPNERPQNIEIRGISGKSKQSNEGCASRKPLIDAQEKPNKKSKTSQSGGSKNEMPDGPNSKKEKTSTKNEKRKYLDTEETIIELERNAKAYCVLCELEIINNDQQFEDNLTRHIVSRKHLFQLWKTTDTDLKILSKISSHSGVQFYHSLNLQNFMCSLCNIAVKDERRGMHNDKRSHLKNLVHYLKTIVGINIADSSLVKNSDKVIEVVETFSSGVKKSTEGCRLLGNLVKLPVKQVERTVALHNVVGKCESQNDDGKKPNKSSGNSTTKRKTPMWFRNIQIKLGSNIKQFFCQECGTTGLVSNISDHLFSCVALNSLADVRGGECSDCLLYIIGQRMNDHLLSEKHFQGLKEAKIRLEKKLMLKSKDQISGVKKLPVLKITDVPEVIHKAEALMDALSLFGHVDSIKLDGSVIFVEFWEAMAVEKASNAKMVVANCPILLKAETLDPLEDPKNVALADEIVTHLMDPPSLNNYCWNLSTDAMNFLNSGLEKKRQNELLFDLIIILNAKNDGDMWKAHVFGSRLTGLVLSSAVSCDIDVLVGSEQMFLGSVKYKPAEERHRVLRVSDWLQQKRNSKKFQVINTAARARVPIVTFIHLPTKLQCDLSFRNGLSVRNSELIRYMVSLDPRVRPLILFLKEWVFRNGFKNILTSYAVSILVIVYLAQLKQPVLPTIQQLRPPDLEPFTIEGWNVSFKEDILWKSRNKESLMKLLTGFFTFCVNFNFEECFIYPVMAKGIPRHHLFNKDKKLPSEIKKRLHMVSTEGFKSDREMCIMDPFDFGYNLTCRIRHHAYVALLALMDRSYRILHKSI